MNYNIDIIKLDNEFAIIQKAYTLKLKDTNEYNNPNERRKLISEIDKLLIADKLIYTGEKKIIDEITEVMDENQHKSKIVNQIKLKSDIDSWDNLLEESKIYLKSKNVNIEELNTYSMLSKTELIEIRNYLYEPFDALKWDQWDYVFVGLAGILATLTDYFFVKIPKDINTLNFPNQKGSKVTEQLRNLKLPNDLQSKLEKYAKVPYDNTGGTNHRIDTLGHDPILGMIFGVFDIMTGKSTTVKNGNFDINSTNFSPELNPLTVLLKQFAHLLSDIGTDKGLPPPFFSFFKMMKFGSFTGPTGKTHDLSSLISWMYYHGYDLRHFITMGITPATVEIILRGFILIRNYFDGKELDLKLAKNPKYRSMLLAAHGIACAGNAGKIYLMGGNPLAFNYAEWIALTRYLLPSINYWLKDKHRIKFDHFIKINKANWENIEKKEYYNIDSKYFDNIEPFHLGI